MPARKGTKVQTPASEEVRFKEAAELKEALRQSREETSAMTSLSEKPTSKAWTGGNTVARLEAAQYGLDEEDLMLDSFLQSKGLVRKHTPKDGACLFRAVAEHIYHTQSMHAKVRKQCVEFLEGHHKDFVDFVCTSNMPYKQYLAHMRQPNTWGGEIELKALARAFDCAFHIYQQSQEKPVVIQGDDGEQRTPKMLYSLSFSHNNHYDVVYTKEELERLTFCQGLVYEMVDKALGGSDEGSTSAQGQTTFKNIELESWKHEMKRREEEDLMYAAVIERENNGYTNNSQEDDEGEFITVGRKKRGNAAAKSSYWGKTGGKESNGVGRGYSDVSQQRGPKLNKSFNGNKPRAQGKQHHFGNGHYKERPVRPDDKESFPVLKGSGLRLQSFEGKSTAQRKEKAIQNGEATNTEQKNSPETAQQQTTTQETTPAATTPGTTWGAKNWSSIFSQTEPPVKPEPVANNHVPEQSNEEPAKQHRKGSMERDPATNKRNKARPERKTSDKGKAKLFTQNGTSDATAITKMDEQSQPENKAESSPAPLVPPPGAKGMWATPKNWSQTFLEPVSTPAPMTTSSQQPHDSQQNIDTSSAAEKATTEASPIASNDSQEQQPSSPSSSQENTGDAKAGVPQKSENQNEEGHDLTDTRATNTTEHKESNKTIPIDEEAISSSTNLGLHTEHTEQASNNETEKPTSKPTASPMTEETSVATAAVTSSGEQLVELQQPNAAAQTLEDELYDIHQLNHAISNAITMKKHAAALFSLSSIAFGSFTATNDPTTSSAQKQQASSSSQDSSTVATTTSTTASASLVDVDISKATAESEGAIHFQFGTFSPREKQSAEEISAPEEIKSENKQQGPTKRESPSTSSSASPQNEATTTADEKQPHNTHKPPRGNNKSHQHNRTSPSYQQRNKHNRQTNNSNSESLTSDTAALPTHHQSSYAPPLHHPHAYTPHYQHPHPYVHHQQAYHYPHQQQAYYAPAAYVPAPHAAYYPSHPHYNPHHPQYHPAAVPYASHHLHHQGMAPSSPQEGGAQPYWTPSSTAYDGAATYETYDAAPAGVMYHDGSYEGGVAYEGGGYEAYALAPHPGAMAYAPHPHHPHQMYGAYHPAGAYDYSAYEQPVYADGPTGSSEQAVVYPHSHHHYSPSQPDAYTPPSSYSSTSSVPYSSSASSASSSSSSSSSSSASSSSSTSSS
ncbi:positive regulation of DNA demethylation [Balamuthia mandrillaris]